MQTRKLSPEVRNTFKSKHVCNHKLMVKMIKYYDRFVNKPQHQIFSVLQVTSKNVIFQENFDRFDKMYTSLK